MQRIGGDHHALDVKHFSQFAQGRNLTAPFGARGHTGTWTCTMGKGGHHVQAGPVSGPVKGAAHLFGINGDGGSGITSLRKIGVKLRKKPLKADGFDQTKQSRERIVTGYTMGQFLEFTQKILLRDPKIDHIQRRFPATQDA